eukprot:TRINITY_DN1151_c0_g1_i1.p2 TRINITY_DN1151_c0_g1~~TRINITY_DN1151_c0_g1_i1.p2  ORF type:complete len:481 (-),score=94.06 TRINITY_DN1151_c0_g1_i1:58-1500(-)
MLLTVLAVLVFPCASSVHFPSGPRKSGIPAEVEIPAPVKNTICLLARISSASLSSFGSNESFGSVVSFIEARSLCAENAIVHTVLVWTMAFSAHKDLASMKETTEPKDSLEPKLDKLAELIRASKHMVFFTGAGISTSAGIPDFRGPEGKWTLEAQGKTRTAKTVSSIKAMPTPTHMSIVKLQKQGICKYLISQNCDGLHRRSGISPEKISELHGNGNIEFCEDCGYEYLRDFHCTRLKPGRDHYTGRHCVVPINNEKNMNEKKFCNGRLMNSTIDFGQNLPQKPLTLAEKNSRKSDLHIVLGSSLTVSPACDMPKTTAEEGAGGKDLVIVNLQKTPLDNYATLRIFAPVDVVMNGIMARLKLDIPKFKLVRYLKVSCDSAGSNLKLEGIEKGTKGQQIPATVFKGIHVGKNLYLEKPNFIIPLEGAPSDLVVKLHFMGNYNEPPLDVPIKVKGETMYKLCYTPEIGKWKVSEIGLDFST